MVLGHVSQQGPGGAGGGSGAPPHRSLCHSRSGTGGWRRSCRSPRSRTGASHAWLPSCREEGVRILQVIDGCRSAAPRFSNPPLSSPLHLPAAGARAMSAAATSLDLSLLTSCLRHLSSAACDVWIKPPSSPCLTGSPAPFQTLFSHLCPSALVSWSAVQSIGGGVVDRLDKAHH